jgi:hypothetical protein
MKVFRWDNAKNERLKAIRGVSFEEIIQSKYLGIELHRRRKNQMIMLFKYKRYVWVVPCVIEEGYVFLKTAFPSRKYTKRYKRGGVKNEKD